MDFPQHGFWHSLTIPIIGLSPMDGVTDAPFRTMVARHSSPNVMFTEFTNVEGIARGATSMLRAFWYDEIERPVVAQIYGVEVDSFYSTAVMLASLGFDGIDVNMGCPANKVAKQGSGAALIRTPDLARAIIRSVKQACRDWANGISLEEAGVHPDIVEACVAMRPRVKGQLLTIDDIKRRELPVSVKTRIGYDEVVTEAWTLQLLEEKPAAISMHGRTLKQMYLGQANWEELAKAAALAKDSPTLFLGNGDVKSMDEARQKVADIDGLDGVLVGRAALGNPWFFSAHSPTVGERLQAAVEHARLVESHPSSQAFFTIRKHLAWYCQGVEGAKALRHQFMQAESAAQVEAAVHDLMESFLPIS